MSLKDRDGNFFAKKDESLEVIMTVPKFEVRHKGYCIEASHENRSELERRIVLFPKYEELLRDVVMSYDSCGVSSLIIAQIREILSNKEQK